MEFAAATAAAGSVAPLRLTRSQARARIFATE